MSSHQRSHLNFSERSQLGPLAGLQPPSHLCLGCFDTASLQRHRAPWKREGLHLVSQSRLSLRICCNSYIEAGAGAGARVREIRAKACNGCIERKLTAECNSAPSSFVHLLAVISFYGPFPFPPLLHNFCSRPSPSALHFIRSKTERTPAKAASLSFYLAAAAKVWPIP